MKKGGSPGLPLDSPACVYCGKCLEVCPLFLATGREEVSPRAKSVLEKWGRGKSALDLARLCLACGRCEAACPQGRDTASIVAGLRAAHPGFRQWLWKAALARDAALWPVAGTLGRLVPENFLQDRLGSLLKGLTGLGRGTVEPLARLELAPEGWRGRAAAFFPGCAARRLAPRWAGKAEALLRKAGLELRSADFGCCGATLDSAGLPGERDAARRANVEAWRRAGRPLIVTACATCGHGLRAYAGSGLFESGEEQHAFAAALTPLSAILQGGRFVLLRKTGAASWHTPCHAPAQDPDLTLLRAVLGEALAVPEARCCGFGGVLQLADPGLSAQVAARRHAGLGRAELILSGCSACVMQLSATAPDGVAAAHWLDILE